MCEPALPAPVRLFVLVGTGMSSRAMSTLHAFGADDGTPNRTPSAWMISAACSLALRQIVFFVWVTLSEHKWVILAERRGPFANRAPFIIRLRSSCNQIEFLSEPVAQSCPRPSLRLRSAIAYLRDRPLRRASTYNVVHHRARTGARAKPDRNLLR